MLIKKETAFLSWHLCSFRSARRMEMDCFFSWFKGKWGLAFALRESKIRDLVRVSSGFSTAFFVTSTSQDHPFMINSYSDSVKPWHGRIIITLGQFRCDFYAIFLQSFPFEDSIPLAIYFKKESRSGKYVLQESASAANGIKRTGNKNNKSIPVLRVLRITHTATVTADLLSDTEVDTHYIGCECTRRTLCFCPPPSVSKQGSVTVGIRK